MPALPLEFGRARRGFRRPGRLGRIAFNWSRCVPLGRTRSPSLGPSNVHWDDAIIMRRRGVGGIILSRLGSVPEGSISLASFVIAGVPAEGLLVEGPDVGLRIGGKCCVSFEVVPISMLGVEREDAVVEPVV